MKVKDLIFKLEHCDPEAEIGTALLGITGHCNEIDGITVCPICETYGIFSTKRSETIPCTTGSTEQKPIEGSEHTFYMQDMSGCEMCHGHGRMGEKI